MIPQLNLKFYVNVYNDVAPQEVMLETHHDADVELKELEGGVDRAQMLESMFLHLINVVIHDGLTGSSLQRDQAFLELKDIQQLPDDIVRTYFQIAGVNVGFWRILCGLIASASDCNMPLRLVKLISREEPNRTVLNQDSVWQQSYPALPASLPFTVIYGEPPDLTKNRIIRLRFQNEITDENIEELASLIQSWEDLHFGGFAEDNMSPVDNASDGYEVYLIDPFTIEHPIDNYFASEDAFNVVIAMVAWFNRHKANVGEVEIE